MLNEWRHAYAKLTNRARFLESLGIYRPVYAPVHQSTRPACYNGGYEGTPFCSKTVVRDPVCVGCRWYS